MQHTNAASVPDAARVSDDIRVAYVALATCTPPPWTLQALADRGPADLLGQLPENTARRCRDAAARLLDQTHKVGARVIVPGDQEWPNQIEDLNNGDGADNGAAHAPMCLWALGPHLLPALLARSIHLTGCRAATSYGTQTAQHLAYNLADGRTGWTIANTGGFGIDAAALHGASLAIDRTPPLVMLPCGIDRTHLRLHTDLFGRVAETGLLLSADPPSTHTTRAGLDRTVAVLAALTTATVIVEAIRRSRRLAAARHAAAISRPVLAVPAPVDSVYSGCNQLIRDGVARLVTNAEDITAHLSHTP